MMPMEAARLCGEQWALGAVSAEGTRQLLLELAKEAPEGMREWAYGQLRIHARHHGEVLAGRTWQAEDRVRWAIRPLIEARTPKAQVEEVAGHAARGVIEWDRIYAILRDEVARVRQDRKSVV